MISVNIFDAGINLPELVEKAQAGEEVVLTSGEGTTPLVRLELISPVESKRLGFMYDPNFVLPDSFWEPLPEEELRLWNGEGE